MNSELVLVHFPVWLLVRPVGRLLGQLFRGVNPGLKPTKSLPAPIESGLVSNDLEE